MNRLQTFVTSLGLVVVATLVGCGPATVADQLKGRWVGKPDPAAGVVQRPDETGTLQPDEETTADPTDLEGFPVEVTLEFLKGGNATMWLGDRRQVIEGSWKVLTAEADRVQLEITDQPPAIEKPKKAKDEDKSESPENGEAEPIAKQAADKDAAPRTQRRFTLSWNDDRTSFTLQEEGADDRFGRLLFKRPS